MKEEPGFQYYHHDRSRFPVGLVVEAGDQYMLSGSMEWRDFYIQGSGGLQHSGNYTLRRPIKHSMDQHFI